MSFNKIIQFLETVDPPRAEGERAFVRKHFIQLFDYPVEDEAVFKAPATTKDRTKPASYEDGEDKIVYESRKRRQLIERDLVRTNRADKKATIVHGVDPQTGQARTYTRNSASGEISVGKDNVTEAISRMKKSITEQTEIFQEGRMSLNDGSVVMISEEQSNDLNRLFNQLTESNKSKMEQKLMSDLTNFRQLVIFAREN